MRRMVAAVLGLALAGCSLVVDVGGFHEWDARTGGQDGGMDAFVRDAFVPEDAFTPEDAFVPDGGPCAPGCSVDEACCDGECVTLDTIDRCGDCDTVCPDPTNAAPTCDGTSCGFTCEEGYDDCNSNAADGCEVDITTATDCGACGNSCDPTELCQLVSGTYTCVSSCTGGTVGCGTSCVDTQTSEMHCGDCDMACGAATGASAMCVTGNCNRTCDTGLTDCDGDIDDPSGTGCEAALASDEGNCGTCGTRCAVTGGSAECVDSSCEITSCATGRGDCDRVYATGCETMTDTRDNCGSCGVRCDLDENCVDGRCQACVPTVLTVPSSMAPIAPAGMHSACFGPSGTCPVAECGLLRTWGLTYIDNRFSVGVVSYDPMNNVVRNFELPGTRYVSNITLDAASERVTFHGQDSFTATTSWSDLRLP